MNDQRDIYLVTGATGHIGTALVHLLASQADQPLIRVATRQVESASALLLHAMNPLTVQPVYFDVAKPDSLLAACAGVTKLCIIAPFVPDMADWHTAVMEAVAAAGTCKYVVKISVTGARSPDSDPPPGRIPLAHWQGEEAVRRSGIPSTMIRPTIFMQHFLMMPGLYTRGDDRFYLPTGSAKIAFLDCRDIATFAAHILRLTSTERGPYQNQSFELTGPTAVTAQEIAATLSWAAERTIEHVDGEAAFVEHCQSLGVGDGLKAVYAEASEGWFAQVEYQAFKQLTGHLPTSFAKFGYDHAFYFGG